MNITPYDMLPEWDPAGKVVEEMRRLLSKEFGVTVQYPFVTVRFGETNDLHSFKSVTMVITEVDDGNEEPPEEDK